MIIYITQKGLAHMKPELHNYDIYPKVFPCGRDIEITVKPMGCHAAFAMTEHKILIHRLDGGTPGRSYNSWNSIEIKASPSEADGCLRFTAKFETECEYFIRIYCDSRRVVQLSVYALESDLACRIPLRGDLHMHTCRSDGSQDPAIVAANYRKAGYDFLAITDHNRYYPSLEAIKKYSSVPLSFNLIPGEEVHVPLTDVHIVNFGGTYSVNGILKDSPNYTETDGDISGRSFGVTQSTALPETLTRDEYEAEIKKIADGLNLPEGVEPLSYAACLWAFDHIKRAGGLGIFAHPYWIADMWHIPEKFTKYMMKEHPFDAFEVLGGENYYQQNGYQAALYYEEWKEGRVHPIVGSTDSHNSTEHNRNGFICSTIVFAHENERCDIISSIKDKYSVAVDTISKEYRLVGEFRYQKYACFLMENWYPLHDSLCETEGKLMKEWYCGDTDTAAALEYFRPKMDAMFKKYFVTL